MTEELTRVTNPEHQEVWDEAEGDHGLRPTHLEEYVGQKKVKENLRLFIEAARLLISLLARWGVRSIR
jgi:Holliday junction resolvasome RuvABC ATP-dependent DNA helicase subunit